MNVPFAIAPSQLVSLIEFENSTDIANRLRPDEPVMCFSRQALQTQAKLFLENFNGETAFAVKANPQSEVIGALFAAGIKVFDVASPAEMELIARYAPGAGMHYHNPVKSRLEIETAYHDYHCRRFAVDGEQELRKIADIIGVDKEVEIAVRLRLPSTSSSVHDFSSKFGATPQEAVELLKQTATLGYQPLVTFHPGSQCHDVDGWTNYIKTVAKIAELSGVTMAGLNIGGGFPIEYREDGIPDLLSVFKNIRQALQSSFGTNQPPIECEPGRALVAHSMSLLTRVKLVRPDLGEIFINDGIYGSLMEASQAPELMPRHRVLSVSSTPTRQFTVFGPTCDPLDRLPLPLELPENIKEGDYIEFLSLGAYGNATATQFNGYGNARVIPIAN